METSGAVLEALGGVLKVLQIILEALELLKSSWKPCWANIAPNMPRKANTLKNTRNNIVFWLPAETSWTHWEALGDVLKALEGILEGLGGVLEALEGVLEVFGGS